jgi:glycosyltransferase involved in cell wall biosynthesis
MQFSILTPSFNNLEYLKLLIKSININSSYNHELIVHVNDGSDGTLDFVKKNDIKFTHSSSNIGLCSAINLAASKATKNYLLYVHDDMYLCPKWDLFLNNEVQNIGHDNFYLSGTMIEPNSGHIKFDAGETIESFDENKLLKNLESLNFFDHQGSHFAPHLVSKKMWEDIGGFSEEFNPGDGSDPDFNMKLWIKGVRIFKGINSFKVYHFSSITIRKNKNLMINNGYKIFLKKWGISIKFFKKYYLQSRTKYLGELSEPNKNVIFFLELFICKIKLIYLKIFKF